MARVPADEAALRFAVDFCNTHDLLADPADRLTVDRLRSLARQHGFATLASGLRERDLAPLTRVRTGLYTVFAATTPTEKAAAVNALLDREAARARLVADTTGTLRLIASGGADHVSRLAVTLADALARALVDGGAERLRTCVGDPCRCVYVDRTRAGRQRYCCELCNDRMASAAYRRRRA
ncbi:MAG: CGNR zinc finger domain-containing protein [Micromonosporaceae bacterium]